jgi:hypothetical protein
MKSDVTSLLRQAMTVDDDGLGADSGVRDGILALLLARQSDAPALVDAATPANRTWRGSRVLGIPVVAIVGVVALGGAAAAASIALSGDVNTGSKDFPAVFAKAAAPYQLAPGDSWAPQERAWASQPGLVDPAGLSGLLGLYSICGWEDSWRSAHVAGDGTAEDVALDHIRSALANPNLIADDSLHPVVPAMQAEVESAARGDGRQMMQDYRANCTGAK